MPKFSQLINENQGFILVEFSAREEVWHIERDQIVFYKNIFTITSVVFAVAFTYWRLVRRYQQMQLKPYFGGIAFDCGQETV